MNMEHNSLSIKSSKANDQARSHHTRIICHMDMHDTPPTGKATAGVSNPSGETHELL